MDEAAVVFFGAGNFAASFFETLAKKYSPVAFGDNDTKKQGTIFMGLPVLSLEEIESRYAGCRFYVMVHETTLPYMLESLTNRGVPSNRIINFQEFKRYKSCKQLETAIYYNQGRGPQGLLFCFKNFGNGKSPGIQKHNVAHIDAMRDFLATRDRIIEELNSRSPHSVDAQIPCFDCREAKSDLWPVTRRLRHASFTHRPVCNFQCKYCAGDIRDLDDSCVSEVEESLDFLLFLKNMHYIDADTEIYFSVGEILIHPLRDRILEAIKDNPCCLHINASAYNERIGEILRKGRSHIVVSIDAGTRETFADIKGARCFDEVCDNLCRYSSDGLVKLKYVIVPGLNDSQREIHGLAAICRHARIGALEVSRDWQDRSAFAERTVAFAAQMMRELRNVGVNASLDDYAFFGRGR